MKSIRLSLIVYFLLLLGLGLGAVAILVYQTTSHTLQAKQEATRTLLHNQYEERCQEAQENKSAQQQVLAAEYRKNRAAEEAALDDFLLSQARILSSMIQLQNERALTRYQSLLTLGLLGSGIGGNGYLTAPLWLAESVPGRIGFWVYQNLSRKIQFKEEELPHFDGGDMEDMPDMVDPPARVNHYIQINSEWSPTWRSRSMGEHFFASDREKFEAMGWLDWKFDNATMPSGTSIRRVILKAPMSRVRLFSQRGPRKPSGFPHPPPPNFVGPPTPSPERFSETFVPGVIIQYACDTGQHDATLDYLQADLEDQLRALDDASSTKLFDLRAGLEESLSEQEAQGQASLASLRNRLLGICLVTFALTVVGGLVLVHVGLLPLRRLSDAVSRVSEKDFLLPLGDRRMPRELDPIVDRLQQTLAMLKRAFAREKQAAADISHELRTPLSALLTTIQVTLKKPRSPEEYREVLAECRESGQQMNQLVERLLTLARLDAEVIKLRQQEVDAALLAEQCATLVRPLAEARSLQLRVHCPSPASIKADPDKLREVFTNLLHNAIEYNRPQGSVELRVQRDNGCLQVEVRDTGIGIAPESRDHIFERFYRADPSREAKDGMHAGLGLAIVKGYVDLMGGSIAVDSTVGQGSTFRIRLPA